MSSQRLKKRKPLDKSESETNKRVAVEQSNDDLTGVNSVMEFARQAANTANSVNASTTSSINDLIPSFSWSQVGKMPNHLDVPLINVNSMKKWKKSEVIEMMHIWDMKNIEQIKDKLNNKQLRIELLQFVQNKIKEHRSNKTIHLLPEYYQQFCQQNENENGNCFES